MSTRSIIKVIKGKKEWMSQYCQNDGYPSGMGFDVAMFIHDKFWMNILERKIDCEDIHPISEDEYNRLWNPIDDILKKNEPLNNLIFQMFKTSAFSRDAGADSLMMIARHIGDAYVVMTDIDDNWIQYVYTIDLDNRKLIVDKVRGECGSETFSMEDIENMDEATIRKIMDELNEQMKG